MADSLHRDLLSLNLATALDRVGGDPELLQEIGRLFLGDYPSQIAEIHDALARQDAPQLERAAHTLKGSAANFGAQAVVEAAFTLEKAGRNHDLKDTAETFSRLQAALQTLHCELEQYCGAL
jgi:HPt (histidine-containing phosphotransfer) domain-containing protein